MCRNAESISIPLRRTQDFVRSVVPVLELLGYDDSVLEGLGSRFVLSVDVDGLRLRAEDSDSPVALEFPWAVIGRVRND